MTETEAPETKPAKKKALRKARKKKLPTSSLAPAVLVNRTAGEGTIVRHWFWIGTMPSIGDRGSVTVAGIHFPKLHETVSPAPAGGGRSERTGHIGQCIHMSRAQMESITECLPRCVYRFTEPPKDVPGPGEGIEALDQTPRRGRPIRIMTDAEIQVRKSTGVPAIEYSPEEWDEPLVDHIFCVPCYNQDAPRPDVVYPDPISVTGVEWPD